MCTTDPTFTYRGLVWSNDKKWAMPNLALFLDGTDEESVYGGPYTDRGIEYPDDDYMRLHVGTLSHLGEEFDKGVTKAWHPVDGTRDLQAVVHVAGSDKVCVKTPTCGTAEIYLHYADARHGGDWGGVTIPLLYPLLQRGRFGTPKMRW